ncbi:FAD-dependent oxidoreductase [Methanobrevibacter sp. DSM 116169]|uniref:FAD-dependent oxidoreductase n=1 Tax=Methanobrevibacter sp. DSM 116169 TaxID=3242727 RepID=UPI0038FC5FC1
MKNIVIGSGPAGRLAALELGKLGEEALLIEKNHIAGTCLNEGCMVICALTDITRFIETNNRFNSYGFLKSQIDISYDKIVEKIQETQVKLRKLNELENESVNNQIIYGKASIHDNEIHVNGGSYNYDKLLISTGARPYIPDMPGNQYGLTNKDILKIDEIPDKLNIIGSGFIACEIANIYSKLGSEVTIFSRHSFLKNIDEDIKKYILKYLISGVTLKENVNVLKIKKNVAITDVGEFEGSTFFAVGRLPNSEIAEGFIDLNTDSTIKVNEFLESSKKNVYAAGDVIGGYQMTPIARMEGIAAARNMAGFLNKIDYKCIPQSISLNMDVSYVNDEKIENKDLKEISYPAIAGPNSFWNILTGDTGLSKISFDSEENKIGNISAISPSSVSDVAYLSYLMRIGADLDDFENFIEIHPSTDTNYKIIKSMWL